VRRCTTTIRVTSTRLFGHGAALPLSHSTRRLVTPPPDRFLLCAPGLPPPQGATGATFRYPAGAAASRARYPKADSWLAGPRMCVGSANLRCRAKEAEARGVLSRTAGAHRDSHPTPGSASGPCSVCACSDSETCLIVQVLPQLAVLRHRIPVGMPWSRRVAARPSASCLVGPCFAIVGTVRWSGIDGSRHGSE
jgi:hypothetical protein